MHSKTPWHVEPAPQGGYVISNEADGFSICLRTAWPNRADESAANAKLLVNSVNAIAALADHLGVDAGELAGLLAENSAVKKIAIILEGIAACKDNALLGGDEEQLREAAPSRIPTPELGYEVGSHNAFNQCAGLAASALPLLRGKE